VAAALSQIPASDAGDEALKRIIVSTGAGTQDTRCAAVAAPVKRQGALATATLVELLNDRTAIIRDYAMVGLAAFGDASAWKQVLTYLAKRLSRATSTVYGQRSPNLAAVDYLVRCLPNEDAKRSLVITLRKGWPRLSESDRGEVARMWPGVGPTGPSPEAIAPPAADRVNVWANPLFMVGTVVRGYATLAGRGP
jgi:hypothetical protein